MKKLSSLLREIKKNYFLINNSINLFNPTNSLKWRKVDKLLTYGLSKTAYLIEFFKVLNDHRYLEKKWPESNHFSIFSGKYIKNIVRSGICSFCGMCSFCLEHISHFSANIFNIIRRLKTTYLIEFLDRSNWGQIFKE